MKKILPLREFSEYLNSAKVWLPLVFVLGWQDIRERYHRSVIGPFWLTMNMCLMIASIGLIFSRILGIPIAEYLPFVAAGIIFWTFITGAINEGCTSFIDAESIIKQLPIPFLVYIFRVLWRNLLILAHNILILPLILLVMGNDLSFVALWAFPGLLIVMLCLSWIMLLFAMLCARYRDLSQIVASMLQIAFYLTPIIWNPSILPDRVGTLFLPLNPFYHLLELIRSPLLGQAPTLTSWVVVSGIALLGWLFTLFVYFRLHKRVAYWL